MKSSHSIFEKYKMEFFYILAGLALLITYHLQVFFLGDNELFSNARDVVHPPISAFSHEDPSFIILKSGVLRSINYELITALVLVFVVVLIAKLILRLQLNFKLSIIHLTLMLLALIGIQIFNNLSIPLLSLIHI